MVIEVMKKNALELFNVTIDWENGTETEVVKRINALPNLCPPILKRVFSNVSLTTIYSTGSHKQTIHYNYDRDLQEFLSNSTVNSKFLFSI